MVALGHRRFAVLAGPRALLTARDRLDGFRAGLAAWRCRSSTARVDRTARSPVMAATKP